MIDNSIDDMTASAFRSAYGVPVISLGETRQTLAMEREALREVYGEHWRDDWQDCQEEFNEDDTDTLTEQEIPVSMLDARGYGWNVTIELVDSFED